MEKLDTLYDTHHLWQCAEDEKAAMITSLQGRGRAATTASWVLDEHMYTLDSLEFIACFGVGVDGIDFDKTTQAGIRVSNTPDVLNDAVADLALGLILATTRNLVDADKFVRNGAWHEGPFAFGVGLQGKTLGIIGLGPNGIFINVVRGSSVHEQDLVKALETQTIAGAALDVYANEPQVPEALLAMENVVLLPHIGSATIKTRRAMGQLLLDNLDAFFNNKPLLTEV